MKEKTNYISLTFLAMLVSNVLANMRLFSITEKSPTHSFSKNLA